MSSIYKILGKLLFAVLWAALLPQVHSQTTRLAFYNAENVFDTLRDKRIDDAEYTPHGAKAWDGKKYRAKIDNLARVIVDLSPGMLGLAEIENEAVLADLVRAVREKSGEEYAGIHLESGDERGIDMALLYRADRFKPIARAMLPSETNRRGILYVKGVLTGSGDTLHVLVNHWTSRYMGQKATESARIDMARLLAATVDSILTARPHAKVFACGDLNDTPDEKSVQSLLRLAPALHGHNDLDTRTYHYDGQWLSFDQIFTNFVPEAVRTEVFTRDYMLRENGTPLRTFSGPVYRNGYSDHLPVYLDNHE